MKKICVFFLSVLLLSGGCVMVSAKAGDAAKPPVHYTQVAIRSGDSLWSIAARYCPEGESTKAYVQEVRILNHMAGEGIFAGDSLILPIHR